MKNDKKTKNELIAELESVHRKIKRFESQLKKHKHTKQDITERKRAEEELRISEERYRMAQSIGHVGNWECDIRTAMFWGSDEAKRIYGFDAKSYFSTDEVENCIQERERVHQALVDLIEQGKAYNLEYEIHPINSSESRIIASVAELQRDKHGDPLKVVGVIQDITERKRLEATLRESELQYRALFNHMSSGVVVYEAIDNGGDFIFRDLNPAAERIEKVSRKDILGKRVSEVFQGIKAFGIFEVFQRVWQTGKPEYFPQNIYKDDKNPGSWRENWIFKLPTGEIIAIYNDITERKRVEEALEKSEEKFRMLFQNNQAIIGLSTVKDGRYIDVNDEFLRVTQFSREEVIGLTALELGIWEFPKQRDQLVEDLRKHGTEHNVEMRIRTKSGSIRTLLCNIERLVFHEELCFLVSAIENTERKRVEVEISKSHEELRMLANHLQNIREEERNHLAREFHDQIGQSMTALKMDLSLLLRMISDEKQDVQRKLVAEELQSMQKLVDEASQLLWAIITELRPQMLDDLGLVSTFEWEAQRFESRTGISCEFKSTAGDIQMDSKKSIALFRIYQEALTNVANHANATVVRSVLRRDNEVLILEIKDNGCGIVFDKQFNPKSFGLIGMRERALAIGGLLEISGIPGEGTTVIVRLPLGQFATEESTRQ